MSGKQTTQQSATSSEDFFLQAIAKKQRNLTKKLQQIADLEKIDEDQLKPEQREKISQKANVKEQIQEQDKIRQFYVSAAQEANVNLSQGAHGTEKSSKKQQQQTQQQDESAKQNYEQQLKQQLEAQQTKFNQQLKDELAQHTQHTLRSVVQLIYASEFFLRLKPAKADDLRRELGDSDFNELANLSSQYTRNLYLTESTESNQTLSSKLDAAVPALEHLLQQQNVRSLVQRVTSNQFFLQRTAHEVDQLTQNELKNKQQQEIHNEVQKQLAAKKTEKVQETSQLGAIGQEQKEKKLQQQQQQQQHSSNFQFQSSAEKQAPVQTHTEQTQQQTAQQEGQTEEQQEETQKRQYFDNDDEDDFIEMSGNNKKKVNEREGQFERGGYNQSRRTGRGQGKYRGNNNYYGGKSSGEDRPYRPAHDQRHEKGERQNREGGYRGPSDRQYERDENRPRDEHRPRGGNRGGRGGSRGGYRGNRQEGDQKREYQPKNFNDQNQEQAQAKKPNFLE